MSRPPLFSVVVPTFGRAAWLQEAIASVLAQTVEDWELVVVDDGSPEAVTIPGDQRVRVVRRPTNGGAAAARNAGIEAAAGEWLAFLDDDDVYTPDRLERAVAGFGSGELLVSWTGRHEQPEGPPRTSRVLEGDTAGTILDAPVPHVGTVTVRRATCVRFDERFAVSEDVEWWLRLARTGPVTTLPHVGYLLRTHDQPRQTAKTAERLRCRLLLLELHADWFADHPGAAAYQWRRAGGLASTLGDRRTARAAYLRSLRAAPRLPTALRAVRTVLP